MDTTVERIHRLVVVLVDGHVYFVRLLQVGHTKTIRNLRAQLVHIQRTSFVMCVEKEFYTNSEQGEGTICSQPESSAR